MSKTKMNNGICVGAMGYRNGTPMRLMYENGRYPDANTHFSIGDIWEIDYVRRQDITEPHNEDVIIRTERNTGYVIENIHTFFRYFDITVWTTVDQLFEGRLGWTGNGRGYSSEIIGLPSCSVGFFRSDRNLIYDDEHYTIDGIVPTKRFKYVGVLPHIRIIPAGTLVRVSLARLWSPPDIIIEKRCYCNLSGWYL